MLQFSIGETQTPMTIHKALVTENPSSLQDEFTHDWKEAALGASVWNDVNEATFASFAQYLYTGDYALVLDCIEVPPKAAPNHHEKRTDLLPVGEDTIDNADEDPADDRKWISFSAKEKPSRRKSGKAGQRSRFYTLSYPQPLSYTSTETRPSSTLDKVYIIQGHARLYVLAEKYELGNLKALVLHKLHSTLCHIGPLETGSGGAGVFIDLVRYIYKNTSSRPKTDGLRELIVRYITMEARQIAELEECRCLIGENGDFANDLLASLLNES